MFRNLRLYRVHSEWPAGEAELHTLLTNVPFEPCGSTAERSAGFEPPAEGSDALARTVGGATLCQLREQTRVLPTAAVNEALAERLEAFEARTARKPGRREKRELKDETIARLMPRALVKSDRIPAFYLAAERMLGVATASEPVAERMLDALRTALGSLNVTPLDFVEPPATLLAALYLGKAKTRRFTVGRECRMVDPAGSGASVVWTDIDISDGSVQRHVRDGLKIERLALVYGEEMSFVLDQEAVFRKIRVTGDEGGEQEEEDGLGRLDARLVLHTRTHTRVLSDLKLALGGYA
jgi:recombination associated protein RdgC